MKQIWFYTAIFYFFIKLFTFSETFAFGAKLPDIQETTVITAMEK